jgi:hypothetical protein
VPVFASINLLLVTLLALSVATGPASAADSAGSEDGGHAEIPHSILAVSVGYALERKRGKDK